MSVGTYVQADYTGASSTIAALSGIVSSLNEAVKSVSEYNGKLTRYCEGPVVDLFSSRLQMYINAIGVLSGKVEEAISACNSFNNKVASLIAPEAILNQEKIDELDKKIANAMGTIGSFESYLYTKDSNGKWVINTNIQQLINIWKNIVDELTKIKNDLLIKCEEVSGADSAGGASIGEFNSAISMINISF